MTGSEANESPESLRMGAKPRCRTCPAGGAAQAWTTSQGCKADQVGQELSGGNARAPGSEAEGHLASEEQRTREGAGDEKKTNALPRQRTKWPPKAEKGAPPSHRRMALEPRRSHGVKAKAVRKFSQKTDPARASCRIEAATVGGCLLDR